MKISYGAVLAPPQEAFRFVADPVNWPLFFPGVRSVDKDDDWGDGRWPRPPHQRRSRPVPDHGPAAGGRSTGRGRP
jgi:hypothetical protein